MSGRMTLMRIVWDMMMVARSLFMHFIVDQNVTFRDAKIVILIQAYAINIGCLVTKFNLQGA